MRLFVGGLSRDIDTARLKELFETIGPVTDAVVLVDKPTGQSKGYGFVTMADADAQKAMAELHQQSFAGRTLTVSEAKPRPERGFNRADERSTRERGWNHERSRGSQRSEREGREPRW